MWTDAELQHDVGIEVASELSAGLRQISITVKDGAVELGGHVDVFHEKCAAERAAWRVAHVSAVTNAIRVVVPFNQQRDDDEIALAAMTILEWNCAIPETVEVQVTGACVTLSGNVATHRERDEAFQALSTLKGIADIRNNIVVPSSLPSGDIKTRVDAALKRNSLVDSGHIKAQFVHGAVSLRGTARSRAEYDEAMRAARAIPGVGKIEDHIAIGSAKAE